ncbi:hypothetical protein ABI59_09575 [Acidobacteria bacterium Mor1]|nr:hypothetical protein ABI59_09575 [Acidobacteria bacterium Mor1]
MQQDPDYESYSLDELYDARDHIDPVRFPLRLKRLDEEIGRRKAAIEARRPPRAVRRPYAGARVAAFLFDYLAISIGWMAVDNLITTPLPALLVEGFALVAFVGYFAVTEGFLDASPGKRIFGLRLDHSLDGRWTAAVLRASIIASVAWIDWSLAFRLPGLDRTPILLVQLIEQLTWGVLAYAAFQLVQLVPDGRLLHDRLTATRVMPADRPLPERAPAGATSRIAAVAASVSVVLLPTLLGHSLGTMMGGNLTAMLSRSVAVERSFGDSMETILTDTLQLRTRVEAEQLFSRTWVGGSSSSTLVAQVKVWIPFRAWNEDVRRAIDEAVQQHITVDDSYEGVSIMVHTGRGLMSLGEATYRER